MADQLRVALVGCGGWGKNILRNLVEQIGVENVAVWDTDQEGQARAKRMAPGVRTPTWTEILQDIRVGAIHAVMVATDPKNHYGYAYDALQDGAHVFVEKPLTLEIGEAEHLIAEAKAAGKVLMVGHLLRYHPAFVTLEAIVRRGDLGALRYVYSRRLNLGKVRPDENVLWSFAPHDLSMLLALAGDRLPERVTTRGGAYLQPGVPDATTTLLDFGDWQAHVFVSWLHPTKEQTLTVVGERGMVTFRDDKLGAQLVFYPYRVERGARCPVPVRDEPYLVPAGNGEPLALEVAHFLACCRGEAQPLTDGAEALRVLRVLDAAQRSMEEKNQFYTVGAMDKMWGKAMDKAWSEAGYALVGPDSPGRADIEWNTGLSDSKRSASPFYVMERGLEEKEGCWYAHPLADVEPGATIGARTKIWRWSHVMAGATIGRDCMIGEHCHIGPKVVIGDGCRIQNGVSLFEGVVLEDRVFVGPNAVFTNVRRPKAGERGEFEVTIVQRGATIGANATIRCGVLIGQGATVGAGAVVTRDVLAGVTVVGNPAREMESRTWADVEQWQIPVFSDEGTNWPDGVGDLLGQCLTEGHNWEGLKFGRDKRCSRCGWRLSEVDDNGVPKVKSEG